MHLKVRKLTQRQQRIAGIFLLIMIVGIALACSFSLPKLSSALFHQPNAPKLVRNARPIPLFSQLSFKDSAAVRFLVVGDWGTGGGLQQAVASAMCAKSLAEHPLFIISTGDNIYNNGVDSVNDPQWKHKFEDIYSCNELQLPWYAVLGNHDHRGNIQAQIDYHTRNPRWNMPARYYSFRRTAPDGTTLDIFAIDTDPLIMSVFGLGNTTFLQEQEHWLRSQLSSSEARWKIVVGHHMVRSSGGYGDQNIMIERIKPLLDTYMVDLYICGHDHDMQFLKAPQDVFYCLISGAGGGARDTGYGENTIFASTNGGFHYIAVSKSQLYVEFVSSTGATLFAHSIHKTP